MTADKTLLKCKHCNKLFKYDSEKKRHEQSHFPQFQCKVCSKNFSFISALRRHEKQHDRSGTVKCTECDREFRDETLLKRHIKYAHGGSYKCTKCDTIFNSETALRTHMQTHKSESERRFQCSFDGCSKKFNFAHHLKHHELTHTNSKQYFCKICDKGFIQSHHLKAHLKTHSADSSLHCTLPDCNKKFATEYAKKRHMTRYHVRMDSGISSDSNSTCDVTTPNILIDNNILSPTGAITIAKQASFASLIENKLPQDVVKDLSIPNNYTKLNTNNIDNEINNCQAAIGRCIMHEEGEECVCKDISKNDNDEYDFTPVASMNIDQLDINANSKANECCGGSCKPKDDKPEIEYKTDGTVKIKEFLDIDIPDFGMKYNRRNDIKFVPYNSCKAVLGNCIVSGDGTIDEGCLCAKMLADEQATAQEIDDITPHPKIDLNMNQYYRNLPN